MKISGLKTLTGCILSLSLLLVSSQVLWASPFGDMYKAGKVEYKKGNYDVAIKIWKTLLVEYKDKAKKPEHLYRVAVTAARAAQEKDDPVTAAFFARKALTFVPDGGAARKILSAVEKNKASDAISTLLSAVSDDGKDNGNPLTKEEAESALKAGQIFAADQNYEKAVEEYRKAGEAGNADACLALGNLYLSGTGVESSQKEAYIWIKKSAEHGNIDAQYRLSRLYREGAGVVTDTDESIKWCKKAAEAGSAEAQCSLGLRYENGTDIEKNLKEAVRLYEMAAKQGYADAQNNLATLYRQGAGAKADPAKAFELYKKAAEQDHDLAMVNLGLCYDMGMGVEKDPVKAASWMKKAADAGHNHACYVYGLFLQRGSGVEKNEKEAAVYFEKAAKDGHKQALKALSELNK